MEANIKLQQSDAIERLAKIFGEKLGEGEVAIPLAVVLHAALGKSEITVSSVTNMAGDNSPMVLQTAWFWRLLVPVRSSGCAEWDYPVFSLNPDDRYELPHFSRFLLTISLETGRLDAKQALLKLYQEMGEPDWEKIPEICTRLAEMAVHGEVTGAQIQAACARSGLKTKTGALIAVLKGGGVISPKLADKAAVTVSRTPRYELHPCLIAALSDQMESEFTENIEKALSVRFEPVEARCLGILLSCFVGREIISYKEIPMKGEAKNETILLAYDERAILPCGGGKGGQWQSRSLSCMPEESYFMPRISRRLVVDASMTGRFDSMDSMQRLWEEIYPEDAKAAIELFPTLMKHCRNTVLEAGLIAAVASSIQLSIDLHDIVDAAGLLGIISPHSRATTVQGLSWYQINPTLFWEQGRT